MRIQFGARFPIEDCEHHTVQELKLEALIRTRDMASDAGMTPLNTERIFIDHPRREVAVYIWVETDHMIDGPINERIERVNDRV